MKAFEYHSSIYRECVEALQDRIGTRQKYEDAIKNRLEDLYKKNMV